VNAHSPDFRATPPVKAPDRRRAAAYGGDMAHETPSDDASTEQQAPVGGDETTEDELQADNAVEADTLKTLDPDDAPA
jgi:hypothetical protein